MQGYENYHKEIWSFQLLLQGIIDGAKLDAVSLHRYLGLIVNKQCSFLKLPHHHQYHR